jgi:hypothetical protein
MAHRPTGLSSAPAAATAAVRGADINLTTRVDLTRRRPIHRGRGSETRTIASSSVVTRRQQHWIETDDPLQTSFLVLPPVEFPV